MFSFFCLNSYKNQITPSTTAITTLTNTTLSKNSAVTKRRSGTSILLKWEDTASRLAMAEQNSSVLFYFYSLTLQLRLFALRLKIARRFIQRLNLFALFAAVFFFRTHLPCLFSLFLSPKACQKQSQLTALEAGLPLGFSVPSYLFKAPP